MKTRFIWLLAAVAVFLSSCSDSGKVHEGKFPFLDKLGVTVTDRLLLGDSLTLPDIYCGDPGQENEVSGYQLNREQYDALIVPAGQDFSNDMALWQLLGVRDVGNGNTLAVYHSGDNVGYCVILMTYDKQGKLLDAINVRELHLVWRVNHDAPDDNNSFTLDSSISFDGPDRLTLHRVMGRCLMDYDNDLKSAPQWQQGWDQDYIINGKGRFVLQNQHVTQEKGQVDAYATMDFKTWDLLVCSLHDEDVMDVWNDYAALVESTYDPEYKYNPFPWDVAQLYAMNPGRFIHWMASHRGSENHLLRWFKLSPNERSGLIDEIGRLEDDGARQWLTGIVASWDDTPITKHL